MCSQSSCLGIFMYLSHRLFSCCSCPDCLVTLCICFTIWTTSAVFASPWFLGCFLWPSISLFRPICNYHSPASASLSLDATSFVLCIIAPCIFLASLVPLWICYRSLSSSPCVYQRSVCLLHIVYALNLCLPSKYVIALHSHLDVRFVSVLTLSH